MVKFEILVVEDQPRHQKIFAETLKHELEVDVRFALTGEEGLKMITSGKKPDLVVLDLDLPTLSGKDVLKNLKANLETRLIPVMVLTGSSSQLSELDLLESGAEDYLEKGSHPDILISRIRAQIRHKKAIDRLQNLAINRDIFAAGILANISAIRKALNDQAEEIKTSLSNDPMSSIAKIYATMDSMCDQASKLGQFANDVIQSVRDSRHSSHPRKVDLDAVLSNMEFIEVEGRPNLKLKVLGNLGTVTIDPNYFRILITNLAQNIRKRTHQVTNVLPTEIYAEQNEDQIRHGAPLRKFVIKDHCAKIDKMDLQSLFEPIITDSFEEHAPSFDINLAVAKNVIEKMSGEIWAEATKNSEAGIEFHFYLPS